MPGRPLAGLREILRAARPGADVELIRRSYDVAAYWHHGQTRRSGDPSITHPLAVATILAGTGVDEQTLCAAMLHDSIEDTPCTLAALSREFGAEIAGLLEGAAALDQIKGRQGRKVAQVLAYRRRSSCERPGNHSTSSSRSLHSSAWTRSRRSWKPLATPR